MLSSDDGQVTTIALAVALTVCKHRMDNQPTEPTPNQITRHLIVVPVGPIVRKDMLSVDDEDAGMRELSNNATHSLCRSFGPTISVQHIGELLEPCLLSGPGFTNE
jgi:hypothetical protein